MKRTQSLCPTCKGDIPAVMRERDGSAWMQKWCPDHGIFEAMVERDYQFWQAFASNKHIYDGLLLDVTYRCNLRCKWCFQKLRDEEPSIEDIMSKVCQVSEGYPIIISGGEPTLRKDLGDIVRRIAMYHPVNVLTNGYNIDWSLPCSWTLSYHEENRDQFYQAIAGREWKFHSMIFTTDTLQGFEDYLSLCLTMGSVAENYRIHMASPVGADSGKNRKRIFVSDMLNSAKRLYPNMVIDPRGKSVYMPVNINGTVVMFIAWNDVENIDLNDMSCAPYYHDSNEVMRHLVTALCLS